MRGPGQESSQNRADGDSEGRTHPSEGVDEVKLLTLERRFLGACGGGLVDRRGIVLQAGVQRAAEPDRVLCQRVFLQLPLRVDAVLQNVSGRALVALAERRDDGILLNAPP